jgi:hypothetical protein
LTCMIDGEIIPDSSPYFYCPGNLTHTLCVRCFADYVTVCCESWATQNTIPIKCQIPQCGYLIPERTVLKLLRAKEVEERNLEERYTRIQLKATLLNAVGMNSKEIAVILCAYCGDYSELYSRSSSDQWQNISKQRLEAECTQQNLVYEKAKQMRKELEQQLEEEQKEKSWTPGERTMRKAHMKCEFEKKLQAFTEEVLKGEKVKTVQIQGELSSGESTSLLFICKNLFCDGAYCLLCKTFFKKQDMLGHICSDSALESLYQQVMETLATSASRACPECGSSGMKDLACTHITCDKCKHKFCYVCGKSEKSFEGGFINHNKWTGKTPWEGSETCPMYLQDGWGDDKSAELALENFHRELQCSALEELRKKLNNDMLWQHMIEAKFNGKAIVEPPTKVDPPLIFQQYSEEVDILNPNLTPMPFCCGLALLYWLMDLGMVAVNLMLLPLFLVVTNSLLIAFGRDFFISYLEKCPDLRGLAQVSIVHGIASWIVLISLAIQICVIMRLRIQ